MAQARAQTNAMVDTTATRHVPAEVDRHQLINKCMLFGNGWHDRVSAWGDLLRCANEGLCNAFSVGVLGEAVTKVVLSAYLMHGDLTARYLVLEPKLTELDVTNFAKASPVGNAFSSTRVSGEDNANTNANVM